MEVSDELHVSAADARRVNPLAHEPVWAIIAWQVGWQLRQSSWTSTRFWPFAMKGRSNAHIDFATSDWSSVRTFLVR